MVWLELSIAKHLLKSCALTLAAVFTANAAFAAGECDNYQSLHPEWDFCTDFETGWPSDWDVPSSSSVLYVSTNKPFQGVRSLEWVYPVNRDSSGYTYKFFKRGYTDVYLRWYLRTSSNWTYNDCTAINSGDRSCTTGTPLTFENDRRLETAAPLPQLPLIRKGDNL
jgi:hypothetical protein